MIQIADVHICIGSSKEWLLMSSVRTVNYSMELIDHTSKNVGTSYDIVVCCATIIAYQIVHFSHGSNLNISIIKKTELQLYWSSLRLLW